MTGSRSSIASDPDPENLFYQIWIREIALIGSTFNKTADIRGEDMTIENERLKTFQNRWSNPAILPQDLARYGFFYTGTADAVQCAFCNGRLQRQKSEQCSKCKLKLTNLTLKSLNTMPN
uniref:Uncharacterized protein n=1 Tax=Romanomermis culicivorax TaxID=13658 RepID=A0A915KBU2_ROMCU